MGGDSSEWLSGNCVDKELKVKMTIPRNESVKAKRTSDLKGMMTTYAGKSVEKKKKKSDFRLECQYDEPYEWISGKNVDFRVESQDDDFFS